MWHRTPVIPLRLIFRSRWAALFWAAGICWSAIGFAGGDDQAGVNAAAAPADDAAQARALAAEDPD